MPVLVEPDPTVVAATSRSLPRGAQTVETTDRMHAWLSQHSDEYAVVLGPSVALDDALSVCETLRITRPTVSVVLVRAEVDTMVLTQAMKSGARDVVGSDDGEALAGAVRRAYQLYVALRGPGGAKQVGRTITVFSPKGGVGKTTMAVNLAVALAEGGARKVCLVDLDLAFGDVAITMQLFPTHSIEQAIGSEESMDAEMLEGLLTRHQNTLMVLAAPPHPDVRERITPALISRLMRVLKESFDFVVVDTAPSFDDQVLTALDETDECVIVASLDVPTLKNVKVAVETLDTLGVAEGHRHLLLNRASGEVGITLDRVEPILGMPVAAAVISSVEVAASTNAGTPIVETHPGHASSSAILQLAARLSGNSVAAPDYLSDAAQRSATLAPARNRSLFKRRREALA